MSNQHKVSDQLLMEQFDDLNLEDFKNGSNYLWSNEENQIQNMYQHGPNQKAEFTMVAKSEKIRYGNGMEQPSNIYSPEDSSLMNQSHSQL